MIIDFNVKDLAAYLNDHLAGSVAAIELLDYLIKEQAGQRLEKFLVDLRDDVSADQQVLRDLIHKLGLEESVARKAGAWLMEKLGQAKIAVAGDERLGLLQALEALALGITGKKLLWSALRTVEAGRPQLQGLDLAALEGRAQEQFDRVEKERLHLAREVFGRGD